MTAPISEIDIPLPPSLSRERFLVFVADRPSTLVAIVDEDDVVLSKPGYWRSEAGATTVLADRTGVAVAVSALGTPYRLPVKAKTVFPGDSVTVTQ